VGGQARQKKKLRKTMPSYVQISVTTKREVRKKGGRSARSQAPKGPSEKGGQTADSIVTPQTKKGTTQRGGGGGKTGPKVRGMSSRRRGK